MLQSQYLRGLATAFRDAVAQASDEFPDFPRKKFRSFPKDTCRHASELLAEYLLENGLTDVYIVLNGYRDGDSDKSHAWVEVGSVIVDITASQFDDVSEDVIINEDHAWHDQFRNQQREPAERDFTRYGSGPRENMKKAYAAIKGRLS
jgi:hypothetical protein